MDHRRALAALLIGVATVGADNPRLPPIAAAKWIVPERRLALLLGPPVAVSIPTRDPLELASRSVGEIAFKTPLLLGGQAARAGLSCASCHINGRSNPGFSFPGISGPPGTADVTSSILSSHRGDGQFNPKQIPDLAADPPKISRAVGDPALPKFIRGLIVEEFDGPEPPQPVLQGLSDYVRGLSVENWAAAPTRPVRSAEEMALLQSALRAAHSARQKGDRATANLMLAGGRAALGRLYERYPANGLKAERAAIIQMDDVLRELQASASSGVGRDVDLRVAALQRMLVRSEARSLYNPARLAKTLK